MNEFKIPPWCSKIGQSELVIHDSLLLGGSILPIAPIHI